MNTAIRRACADDAYALATLNAVVQALHAELEPAFFRSVDMPAIAAWFRTRLADPDVLAWMAEHDGVPVGYALVVRHERPATPFTVATRTHEIDQLGVHPAAQRRGIARALVRHVAREADADGASAVTLKSWVTNASAQHAFQRLGFSAQVVQYQLALDRA